MAHARGRTFRGRSVQKRDSLWLQFAPGETSIAAAATATLISVLNTAALALRPFTIVRTRFILGIRSDQSAASETQQLAYGHVVVQDTATAIGVTAVPTPVTDMASDWHVYEQMVANFQFKTGVGIDSQNYSSMVVDSKAMRKVDFGQDLAVVAETAAGSAGLILYEGGRILVKLH